MTQGSNLHTPSFHFNQWTETLGLWNCPDLQVESKTWEVPPVFIAQEFPDAPFIPDSTGTHGLFACLPVRQSTFKQAQVSGKEREWDRTALTTLQLSSITPVIKRTGKICCGERWGMPKSNKGSRWQRQMGRGEGIRLSLATTSHDAGLHIVLVLQRLFWMETI